GLAGITTWLGLLTAIAAVAATGIGFAWTIGIVSFDRPLSYSALSLHVIAGLALSILVVVHALVRGEHRPSLISLAGRRSVLRGHGLATCSHRTAPRARARSRSSRSPVIDGRSIARRSTKRCSRRTCRANPCPRLTGIPCVLWYPVAADSCGSSGSASSS